MDWFEKIKAYYDSGFWSIEWVRNAVEKKKITAEQFEIITGTIYTE
jgi:uncharacterized XkdX family phage protein